MSEVSLVLLCEAIHLNNRRQAAAVGSDGKSIPGSVTAYSRLILRNTRDAPRPERQSRTILVGSGTGTKAMSTSFPPDKFIEDVSPS
jgi:hypothetical protein